MHIKKVKSLSKSSGHTFSKKVFEQIKLVEGFGVEDDAHSEKTVKHRSRVARDPAQPNLRQVHLIHSELFEELSVKGFFVKEGEMGENITSQGIDLLNLPKDTILKIGTEAEIIVTGLRNPCNQLDSIKMGLLKAVLDKDENGNVNRKCGIMGVVTKSGIVRIDDTIEIIFPQKPFEKLVCV